MHEVEDAPSWERPEERRLFCLCEFLDPVVGVQKFTDARVRNFGLLAAAQEGLAEQGSYWS